MTNFSTPIKFIHLFWYVVLAVAFFALVLSAVGGRVAMHISSDIRVPLAAIDMWTRTGLYSFFAILISGLFLMYSATTPVQRKKRRK